MNSIELLGDTFFPGINDRLTEPVEVCLPVRSRNAGPIHLDPAWTILDTTVKDGQVCAETVRVAWLTLVLTHEDEAA